MYGNRFMDNDKTKSCLNFSITIFREFHACLCKDKPKTMINIPNDICFILYNSYLLTVLAKNSIGILQTLQIGIRVNKANSNG
jgi:hypothetical protein